MSTPDRMFIINGEERGYGDPAELYESRIDPLLKQDPGPQTKPVTVEEWTTRTGRSLLPHATMVVERIADDVYDEAGEFVEDFIADTMDDPAILEAAEALCVAMGKRARFFLGRSKVAEHTVSWDADGEPLWNGERLYRKRADAQV